MLQRRLASSPEAILTSLERRRKRLERRRREMQYGDARTAAEDQSLSRRLAEMLGRTLPEDPECLDDLSSGEAEEIESEVADAATTARTVVEFDKEISLLEDLE